MFPAVAIVMVATAVIADHLGALRRSAAGDRLASESRELYYRGLDSSDRALVALVQVADSTPGAAQMSFRRARVRYKRVEALAEYYAPSTSRSMNGPNLDRPDDESPEIVIPATGFQVIEEALFPAPSEDWQDVVRVQAPLLRTLANRLRVVARETEPTDMHVFAAARLEIARVTTLGLAGFDAGSSGDAVGEAAEALRGVRAILNPYRGTSLNALLDMTIANLEADTDFERFDRLGFIVRSAEALGGELERMRQAQGIAATDHMPWRAGTATMFQAGAFSPLAYASANASPATASQVELGRALFHDRRLSGRKGRACSDCHRPTAAFTDGAARRTAFDGTHDGRNTPTLLNAALQPAMFHDGRAAYLEDQIADVMRNPAEMGQPLDVAARALSGIPVLRAQFDDAFPNERDDHVTSAQLRRALAAYLRTLTALDSRFDRALRGDTNAVTRDERRGFNVFMGKAKCGTCHFLPLFNGSTPPLLMEAEPEVIGVPATRRASSAIDPDVGRFGVDRVPLHLHAFRTPTLRNVAVTAPYMHNGVFRTLEEVIEFYDAGGGIGRGLAVPNQTLPGDSLHLTPTEKHQVISFLRALTDTSSMAHYRAGTPPRR